jgi:aminopeptidase N
MKKLVVMLAFVMICSGLSAQRNPQSTDGKCSRSRSAAIQPVNKYNPLMDDYDVVFCFLDIALERTSTYISGSVLTRARALDNLSNYVCELIDNLTVDSVKLNGTAVSFTHSGDEISAAFPASPAAGDIFEAEVFYHGDPQVGGSFFSGISNDFSPSWGNQVTWTLSEPFNARQWWPCKQSLTDKIDSAWVFITTSNANKAGSNGLLTAVTPLPGNKARYEWKTRYKIDYYLISASVAKYVDYSIWAHPAGSPDSLLIQNYVYDNPSTLPYFKTRIDTTILFIELYSDLLGLYPFINEKYGHCMAPMGGGMEHQTMTTLGFFEFYLVCHELMHQWFGDYVTCGTWSDIWINEGFASYGEYIAAENIRSHQAAQVHMQSVHTNVMSQPGGSVYIPPAQATNEQRIFDGRLSYDKGSAIIHSLRFELQNDTVFYDILKTFLSTYGDSTATGEDFRAVAEAVSGRNFYDFYQQWYYGEGYPSFDILYAQWGDTLIITSVQSVSMPSVTPLFKTPLEIKLYYQGGGDTTVLFYQDNTVNNFKLYNTRNISGLLVDPNNWILNGPGNVTIGTCDKEATEFVSCYPNPCSREITFGFTGKPGMREISIHDLSGRLVFKETSAGSYCQVSVEGLAPGTYIYTVRGEGAPVKGKFIRQ